MPNVFDCIGWCEATPGTGVVRLAAGLNDQLCRRNADLDGLIVLDRHAYVLGMLVTAVSTGREGRLDQADLQIDHQFMKCALCTDLDPTQGWAHHYGYPLPIMPGTTLWAEIQNATDEAALIGAFVGSGAMRTAEIEKDTPTYKIIGISDTTVTALTWSTCEITWDQQPPKGVYAVIGMRAFQYKAGGYIALARLLVPGMLDYRPGVPMAVAEADHEEFQSVTNEPWVNWGMLRTPKGIFAFTDDQMPNIEVLSIDAGTDQNVELLIKKIG